jgi:peptidoglycan hydrolase-like protein with peptidoglycan-binding domain
MLIDDRSVQRALQAGSFYGGKIDGINGPATKLATRNFVSVGAELYKPTWPDARVRICAEQMILEDAGFYRSTIDGLNGPATQAALEKWQDFIQFNRPSPAPDAGVLHANQWPRQNYADLVAFYGKPGENQVRVESPYPLYLDWDLSSKIDSFFCHEKVAGSISRVLNRVLVHYGKLKIHELGLDQFGGCLNVRKMRNGSSWSTHAWGIAIDWDADRNTLRETKRTARLARPEYAPFLDLWEQEGWISLGRARNYDWMHVQAARL